MLVSVIIPVYNADKFLDKCIQSVINQSYTNWELILINDGSTDESGLICDTYAQNDKRIKIIHNKNQGVSVTRNIGINKATGDYLFFLDADDYLPKDSLKTLIYYIEKHPELDVIKGFHECLMPDGEIVSASICKRRSKYAGRILDSNEFYTMLEKHDLWGALYRRKFIVQNKIYFQAECKSLLEDSLFLTKLLSFKPVCYLCSENCYIYRVGVGNSLTNRSISVGDIYSCIYSVDKMKLYESVFTSKEASNAYATFIASCKMFILNALTRIEIRDKNRKSLNHKFIDSFPYIHSEYLNGRQKKIIAKLYNLYPSLFLEALTILRRVLKILKK